MIHAVRSAACEIELPPAAILFDELLIELPRRARVATKIENTFLHFEQISGRSAQALRRVPIAFGSTFAIDRIPQNPHHPHSLARDLRAR